MRSILFAMLLIASVASGEDLSVKSRTYYAIVGAEPVITIGERLFFDEPPTIASRPVGVIRVDSEASNIEVTASDVSRLPVDVERLDENLYLIAKPGKYWVDVTAIDFEKNLYGRKTVMVEIGDGPSPPPVPPGPEPEPGPTPTPDGPFDGLAAKVNQLAATMQPDKRFTFAGVFDQAVAKMESREFLQISQASRFIAQNQPQCTVDGGCRPLYEFLAMDGGSRTLSFYEAISYYREVAKGLR